MLMVMLVLIMVQCTGMKMLIRMLLEMLCVLRCMAIHVVTVHFMHRYRRLRCQMYLTGIGLFAP